MESQRLNSKNSHDDHEVQKNKVELYLDDYFKRQKQKQMAKLEEDKIRQEIEEFRSVQASKTVSRQQPMRPK